MVAVKRFSQDRSLYDGESPMSALPSFGLRLPRSFLNSPGQRPITGKKAVTFFCTFSGPATCLLALSSLVVVVPGASAGFLTALNTPAGLEPSAVAVGDFNEDGIPDLVLIGVNKGTGNPNETGQAMVLLGRGDGTFQAGAIYLLGAQRAYDNWQVIATSVAVGDFNRDGHLDLAVTNSGDNTISVLLGNGDGTFQAPQNTAVGIEPLALAVADFNGDGYLDVAVLNSAHISGNQYGEGTVGLLLGNGDGSFQPAQTYQTGRAPSGLAVGDFNCDGALDLAVTIPNLNGGNGTVAIFLGKGDGSFQAAQSYAVGPLPQAPAVADFNGDGHLDLAVPNQGYPAKGVSVLLGNGDGTFQAAQNYATNSTLYSLAVGDFNADGRPDLVLVGPAGAAIWLGQGDGTFQAGQFLGVGAGPVAVADFNQDAKSDLAVIDSGSAPYHGVLSVLLGKGDGAFLTAPSYPVGKGYCGPLAVGDFNGDGIADLAVAEGGGTVLYDGTDATVVIWFGNGDGSFRQGPSFLSGQGTWDIAVADFNGDGKQDLLVTNYYVSGGRFNMVRTSDYRIFLGNGDGTFQNPIVYPNDHYPPFPRPGIGDFNGDGIPDLALATSGPATPQSSSCTVSIWLGKGDGTFQVGPSYQVAGQYSQLATGDFNGDGILDLAVVAAGLTIFLGKGDGTFQSANQYAVQGGFLLSLALGDFNGDGLLDIALNTMTVDYNDGKPGLLNLFSGNGDGSFQAPETFPAGVGPGILAVGDFNGDGIQDLAFTGGMLDSVSVMLGKSDGTLVAAQNFACGSVSVTGCIAVADFNGDGNLDLAVANTAAFSILLNDGHWPR
jgi:hypothetical protein